MKRARLVCLVLPLFGGGVAHASDPVGVYAAIKKVAFEPDAQNPQRVRVCGAFALANINTASYFAPAAGYMYYSCKPGEEAACKMQWAELASAADSGVCVAYGARRDTTGSAANNGTVRTALPPPNPEVYVTGLGVVKMPVNLDAPVQCKAVSTTMVSTTACDTPDMRPPEATPDLAGTADLRTPPAPPPPTSSCAVAPRAGVGGGLGLGLLLMAGALLRRRRR